jgi:polynucleotide 5'-hydroxyl-kinase GRC3/NOL9
LRHNETLLMDGPAALRILSGEGTIFGAAIGEGEGAVVREGKRMPLTSSSGWLSYEATGESLKVQGEAIPMSWRIAADAAASVGGRVVVLGGVDAGKTGFCTYLANRAVRCPAHVGYVDGDLGQPETGPPTTITSVAIDGQSYTLEAFRASSTYFIGHTSPTSCQERVIEAIERCALDLEGKGTMLVVVNTDGWVKEGGLRHKSLLVGRLRANTIVSLLSPEEERILRGQIAGSGELIHISRPPLVRSRSRDERRENRERGYRAYFRGAKVRKIGLKGVRLIHSPLPPMNGHEELDEEEGLSGGERGMLVGLIRGTRALGLGIVLDIDLGRRTMELLLPAEISRRADAIEFGGIRLDESFRESCPSLGRSIGD